MAQTLTVVFNPTPVPANTKLLIEATAPISQGRSFVTRSQYKVVSVVNAAAASPANILSAYTTIFGPVIAGMKIFVRVTPINSSGIRGVASENQVIAT